jgi:hypothetical protein
MIRAGEFAGRFHRLREDSTVFGAEAYIARPEAAAPNTNVRNSSVARPGSSVMIGDVKS